MVGRLWTNDQHVENSATWLQTTNKEEELPRYCRYSKQNTIKGTIYRLKS
jgi:hypothetical protein